MAKLKIPRKLGEVTPEWLTAALRAKGILREARVIGIEREALGEGEGFLGQLERLQLRYDVEEAGAPESAIIKLPSLIRQNRVMGEMLGVYEREIYFYQELASKIPSRIPRVYYAEMDTNPLSKHSSKIVAWMDRRPRWFIAAMLLLTLLFVSLSRRRYAVLMEDMAPARLGDQVAGAGPEVCQQVLADLAILQAAFWQSPELDAHFWLMRQDIAVQVMGFAYRRSLPGFKDRFLGRHPELSPYLDWLDENFEELTRLFHQSAPHTLLHMDFRLDNLFFLEQGEPGNAEIAIFDWQTVSRGPGVYDAAYFIVGALHSDCEAHAEEALIVAYHDRLLAGGVANYSLASCELDYRRALILILHRLASTDIIEFGEERGAALINGWVERLSARVTGVEVASLL